MTNQTRILIVEDSPLFAEFFEEIMKDSGLFDVVGVATTGKEATRIAATECLDIITMDIHLPDMSGLDAIRNILSNKSTRIVVLTGDPDFATARRALDALTLGALDVRAKPTKPKEFSELATYLKKLTRLPLKRPSSKTKAPLARQRVSRRSDSLGIVAIAASAGGPQTLVDLLNQIPKNFPVPIVVAQHMSPEFSHHFCAWLGDTVPQTVRLGVEGARLEPGTVSVAPAGAHMRVASPNLITLDSAGPLIDCHKPSCSALFDSVAKLYGRNSVGIQLTGMGADGVAGLLAMKQAGAYTIAQNAESAIVGGMPRRAQEKGACCAVMDVEDIANYLRTRGKVRV